MSDMPEEVKAWRSIPLVDHCGTWSETRYPEEAIVYIRSDLIDMDVLRRVEAALMRQHAWHLSQTEPVDMGGVEVVPFEAYAEGSMCEETGDALTDLRAMMEKLK